MIVDGAALQVFLKDSSRPEHKAVLRIRKTYGKAQGKTEKSRSRAVPAGMTIVGGGPTLLVYGWAKVAGLPALYYGEVAEGFTKEEAREAAWEVYDDTEEFAKALLVAAEKAG